MSTTHHQAAGAPRPADEPHADCPPTTWTPRSWTANRPGGPRCGDALWVGMALLGGVAWS
ncbi:hypothetical protein QJS66_09690 [Kocuria rhizophila]|nr:hypothetical protein QJS66_09690 [Kocuria rhizophila]